MSYEMDKFKLYRVFFENFDNSHIDTKAQNVPEFIDELWDNYTLLSQSDKKLICVVSKLMEEESGAVEKEESHLPHFTRDQADEAMEEEIDIDEHDVLDNPRIKDMFLDIADIKTEVLDDDGPIIDFEDSPPKEQYETYIPEYNENLTEQKDEPADYSICEPFSFTNKIILGSKPNKDRHDSQTLYDEALNSHTYVNLEDWGVKLQSSPCYCIQCKILFPTINALDSHNMIAHSFLVEIDMSSTRNMARKSTMNHMKNCHHCNKLFSDDNALIKHLYELLPLRDKAPQPVLQGYQCPTCSCCYTDIREMTTHLKLNHGIDRRAEATIINFLCPFCSLNSNSIKLYNLHIAKMHRPTFCKKIDNIERKNFVTVEDSETSASERSLYNRCSLYLLRNCPIPKAAMFVCTKCTVHFVSAYFALRHYQQCKRALQSKPDVCKTCNKHIRSFDRYIHEMQHTITSRIKSYKINADLYKRVLCKCPKCEVCFEDNDFWMHFPRCGSIDAVFCRKCNLTVSDSNHFVKHRRFRNFILVDFVPVTDAPTELIPTNKSIDMKERIKNGLASGRGKGFVAQTMRNGADVKKPEFTAESSGTDKRNTMTLYYCHRCECCFSLSKGRIHLARTEGCEYMHKGVCQYCGLFFTKLTHHIELHKQKSLSLHDFKFVTTDKNDSQVPTMPNVPKYFKCERCAVGFVSRKEIKAHVCKRELKVAKTCSCGLKFNAKAYELHSQFHIYRENLSQGKIMPKLLMQYELMDNMWNILFYCQHCRTNTDSYDTAVDHAQKHLARVENFGVVKVCKACSLHFDEVSYDKHKSLHDGSVGVNKSSFIFLVYNFTNLLKRDWFKLFQAISDEQKEYILTKSIYGRVRNVKMRCVEMGMNDATTEYRCGKCRQHVEENAIYAHAHLRSCYRRLQNSAESVAGSRVVIFNAKGDELVNNALKLKVNKYNLYKCVKCTVCTLYKSYTKKHKCWLKKKRKFCKHCGEFFPLGKHEAVHRKYPDLHKGNINIVRFGHEKAKTKRNEVVVVYKCKCGLHFSSKSTLTRHKEQCGDDVSSETCSKCGLLFPTDILVSHLHMHHLYNVTFEVRNDNEPDVYRCLNRDQIFATKTIAGRAINAVKCKRSAEYLDDMPNSPSAKVFGESAVKSKLYTCKACDVNFNLYASFLRHQCPTDKSRVSATPCSICGLRFATRSSGMSVHKQNHHSEKEYRFVLVDPVTSENRIFSGYNHELT